MEIGIHAPSTLFIIVSLLLTHSLSSGISPPPAARFESRYWPSGWSTRRFEHVARGAGFEMKVHPHMLRLRLQAGKRWCRYPHDLGLFGTQIYPAYGALY